MPNPEVVSDCKNKPLGKKFASAEGIHVEKDVSVNPSSQQPSRKDSHPLALPGVFSVGYTLSSPP